MPFEIDPRFQASGKKARLRQRNRLLLRLGGVAIGIAVLGLGVGFWFSRDAIPPDAVATGFDDTAEPQIVLVQTEDDTAATGARADPRLAFLNIRRDPMILRLPTASQSAGRSLPWDDELDSGRFGGPQTNSFLAVQDNLFVADAQLLTTLPSSRAELAFFQEQRSAAIAAADTQRDTLPVAVHADAGEMIRIEDDDSFGRLISDDQRRGEDETGVFVQTRIENTTSIAMALRETQRDALFTDDIVVLQTDRALLDTLQGAGLSEDSAALAARAAMRLISAPENLPPASIVAMRLRPDPAGLQLLQMSIYLPEGYFGSIAQVGAGRFEASADPWLAENLFDRAGQIRQAVSSAPQDIRLLDAIYSAAIRNGLPTRLVGELIVILSQRFDLDRFAVEGDRLTVLFAAAQGEVAQSLGQVLYVGIEGPETTMQCFVTPSDGPSGFSCFDFDARVTGSAARAGQLGGGLQVPVNGVLTSGFGPRRHPILNQVRQHQGVDWAAPTGTPIRAAAAGRISFIGDAGGYGNLIMIDHPSGLQTRYAHMDRFAPGLQIGTSVDAGQDIGTVGTTGRSTGPHLHFELRVNGDAVDPLTYDAGSGGASGAVEALVNQIIQVESAGDARAKNPLSTATGLGQFIESTWLRMMRDYRPELYSSMNRAQLLELRFDPSLSREMVTNLARENERFLRSRGHAISSGRLYLAHFLGPSGAHTALSADPQATVHQVMGSAVVNANPFLRNWVMSDLLAWADRKMVGAGGSGAVTASVSRPVATPPEIRSFRETVERVLSAL